ncbi:hypothetical protein [Gyrovirus 10]|uniref:Capsid protein n=1 Tax=Gyrovirus 10 TaxID=2218660 RepID=A0A2U9N6R0_9VIRU|nr:hypothetical protein [Gyrovirus 10]
MGYRSRGKFYTFRRGRWRKHRRFRPYRRRRRFRFRKRKFRPRYGFRRRFKRAFWNQHPGSYVVRLPNPQNTLNLMFQGIVWFPLPKYCINSTNTLKNIDVQNVITCRVGSIHISLKQFLLAVMSLSGTTKLGGPSIGKLYYEAKDKLGQAGNYPYMEKIASQTQSASLPSQWWRWAIMFMYPPDNKLIDYFPAQPDPKDLQNILGGWSLFRHKKTKVAIIATSPQGNWSPVASLTSQDSYFMRHCSNVFAVTKGNFPLSGAVGTKTPTSFLPDECEYPSRPPQAEQTNQTGIPGQCYTRQPQDGLVETDCWYSQETFPSFGTLSALGASWAFPPGQRSFSHGSVNHHTITGSGDPEGQRWRTLNPLTTFPITSSEQGSDYDRVIASIYLAQGSDQFLPYKYGTDQDQPNWRPQKFTQQMNVWARIGEFRA